MSIVSNSEILAYLQSVPGISVSTEMQSLITMIQPIEAQGGQGVPR